MSGERLALIELVAAAEGLEVEWIDNAGVKRSDLDQWCSEAYDALQRARDVLNAPVGPVTGVVRIAEERFRQIDVEGWTPEHDAGHTASELAQAAATYAMASLPDGRLQTRWVAWWPWELSGFKPADPVRNLEKAGALIAAEIDRLLAVSASPASSSHPTEGGS